jgi:hypothetical protein
MKNTFLKNNETNNYYNIIKLIDFLYIQLANSKLFLNKYSGCNLFNDKKV